MGGTATLAADLTLTNDMDIGAGSLIKDGSVLKNGSTLGGDTTLANDETVDADSEMLLKSGTSLAAGTTLTEGTFLTDDITAVGDDGNEVTYSAGTLLTGDITTAGTNTLDTDMTIQGNSKLAAGTTLAANVDDPEVSNTVVGDSELNTLSSLSVLSQDDAQKAISIADAALKDLDKVRADLGSVQNQLTSTISNISTTRVNVLSAESTIRDVDFADEASNFTKLQILAQAGTFAMSQANASSQGVLSLLG